MIMQIARENTLFVVEDAAHALPSVYKGKIIGTLGKTTCFSFYATKTITTGEGGMVTTNDSNIADKIKRMRLHGISGDAWNRYSVEKNWYYDIIDLGYKYNTTDLQSALGLLQLDKLQRLQDRRKEIAYQYIKGLAGKIEILMPPENVVSSWHLFVIKIENRDYLFEKLKENGVHSSVHFIPLHHHSLYKKQLGVKKQQFPNANRIFEKSLSLPIYPDLKDEEIKYIIEMVLKFSNSSEIL